MFLRFTSLERFIGFACVILPSGCGAAPDRTVLERDPELAAICPAVSASSAEPTPGATAVASASTRAANEPRPPTIPLFIRAGERALVVTYTRTSLDTDVVGALALDNVTLYPPDCTTARDGLCSPSHQALRGDGASTGHIFGKGRDLSLLAFEERDDRAYALFGATTIGSPECGAYAFWILRLDAKGIHVTPPLEGCFNGGRPAADPRGAHPLVAWTDPAVLWVENPAYSTGPAVTVFTLDEATMTFTKRLEAASPKR